MDVAQRCNGCRFMLAEGWAGAKHGFFIADVLKKCCKKEKKRGFLCDNFVILCKKIKCEWAISC